MHGVSYMICSAKIFDFKLRRDHRKNFENRSVDDAGLSKVISRKTMKK